MSAPQVQSSSSSTLSSRPNEKAGAGAVLKEDAQHACSAGSVDDAAALDAQQRDRKLLRKLDLHIMPFITLLFTMSFIDRINIGVAGLVGLRTDLALTPLQFQLVSALLFVTYVAFEVPSNLILKRMKPSRWIPFITVCWGICQLAMGFVKTYHQLLALRLLLGLFECSLFPGLSFYLSSWYKRNELGLRVSLFFSGAVLAGAFGGILGYALSRISTPSYAGWRFIFLIEGAITVVVGIAAIWLVQDFPLDAKFITEEERELVIQRLRAEARAPSSAGFQWRYVLDAIKDPRTGLFMLCYIGCAEGIYSQSLFSPTIIAALGKWTRPQSLLLSVPPYALAFITTIGTALASDRLHKRGPFMIFWSSMSCIGYIILVTVGLDKPGVLYFAVFLTVASIAPCIAITIVWSGSSFGPDYKRATSMGLVFTLGNSGGIVASFAYRSQDAPRYLVGNGVTLGFSVLCLLAAITLSIVMKRENARRDALYGPAPLPPLKGETYPEDVLQRLGLTGMSEEEILDLGDKHPAFRYSL